MALKRVGERASAKPSPSLEEVERLANELADRPYGSEPVVQEAPKQEPESKPSPPKRRSITLSLPGTIVAELESKALENKHLGKKDGNNVSALVLAALKKAGYKA